MIFSLRRIWGILLRQSYIFFHSPPMIVNLVAWPLMNTLVWGFMNTYLAKEHGGVGMLAGNLVASALIWEFYVRCCWGLTGCVDEEFLSRNLGSMMATPASLGDYVTGFIIAATLKAFFALSLVASIVWLTFDFSIG